MKKLFLILLVVFMASSVWADDKIQYVKTHDGVTVGSGSTSTSDWVRMDVKKSYGSFSIQLTVTGSGTAKVEYLLSNDNTTYLEPSSASDITTGFTASSGPGSNGKDMFSFSPMVHRFMKIKVTETGGANSVTVTASLVYQ